MSCLVDSWSNSSLLGTEPSSSIVNPVFVHFLFFSVPTNSNSIEWTLSSVIETHSEKSLTPITGSHRPQQLLIYFFSTTLSLTHCCSSSQPTLPMRVSPRSYSQQNSPASFHLSSCPLLSLFFPVIFQFVPVRSCQLAPVTSYPPS